MPSKEGKALTATKATRKSDVECLVYPFAERHRYAVEWNGIPGFDTAVSVQIEAEEAPIADRVW